MKVTKWFVDTEGKNLIVKVWEGEHEYALGTEIHNTNNRIKARNLMIALLNTLYPDEKAT